MASVRLFLAMAALKHWPLFQLDIKNGFLYGDKEEEIYMVQPLGLLLRGSRVLYINCRSPYMVRNNHLKLGSNDLAELYSCLELQGFPLCFPSVLAVK